MNYTAQIDSNNNVIVCRGSMERNGYRIAMTGSYEACLRYKLEAMAGRIH